MQWRAWMEIAKANLQENVELHDWDLLSSKKKSKDLPSYPDSWEWGGEHFAIAKSLSKEDWNWYKSLPLSIYGLSRILEFVCEIFLNGQYST